MSEQQTVPPSARWPSLIALLSGILVTALGLTVIAAWYAHWSRVLQIFPSAAPMQFNTALSFILCGAALFLLQTRRMPAIGILCGGAAALLTSLTLLEYLTGRDLGVDLLLFKPYFEVATAYPGRMAPLSACCFVAIATGLVLASIRGASKWRLPAAGLLACIVAVVGTVALLGYLTSTGSAYGWGAYSRMAFNTAVGFLLLGGGTLLLCCRMGVEENRGFLHWVPIAASSTLIVMMAIISVATVFSLRSALQWRKHTYDVLLAAEIFEANIKDIQWEMRAFLVDARPASRETYFRSAAVAQQAINRLLFLTHDNSGQQQRLNEMAEELGSSADFNQRLFAAWSRQPLSPASTEEFAAEEQGIFSRTDTSLSTFKEEEQRLLGQRSAAADTDFHSAARLLIFGSAMAAAFFIGGTLLVRREARRRRQVELNLHEARSQVKILSGLLPICASCKSIRDDKGYWSQIECYITEHSDATFSHGLCEDCVRKLYPGMADRILSKLGPDAAGN